jgi:hypothetical protein
VTPWALRRSSGFSQNDAHIYCTYGQAKDEFLAVMRMHDEYYRALGISDFSMVLALRDPANKDKYHDDEQMWATAERITREAMEESNIPYVEDPGGAAHYGDYTAPTAGQGHRPQRDRRHRRHRRHRRDQDRSPANHADPHVPDRQRSAPSFRSCIYRSPAFSVLLELSFPREAPEQTAGLI